MSRPSDPTSGGSGAEYRGDPSEPGHGGFAFESGAEAAGVAPEPEAREAIASGAGRPHLVVVRTRSVRPEDGAPPGARLHACFWHPRERRWSATTFESLEHAMRLFVDESGWRLVQRQALDGPDAAELIFEAHRADFARPSTEEILEDVGISREDVTALMERLDREARGAEGPSAPDAA